MQKNTQYIENNHQKIILISLFILLYLFTLDVQAGTTGAEWKGLSDLATNWLGGYLGKFMAIVGCVITIISTRFSIMGVLGGSVVGVVIAKLPTIASSMVTAII